MSAKKYEINLINSPITVLILYHPYLLRTHFIKLHHILDKHKGMVMRNHTMNNHKGKLISLYATKSLHSKAFASKCCKANYLLTLFNV